MKSNTNFTCTVSAKATAEKAVKQINTPSLWWGKSCEALNKVDDVFTYRSDETWVTFKLTELIPGKKAVWYCTDGYLHWLNDKKEWKDTQIVWEVTEDKNGITVNMTHVGLSPEVECFEQCQKGWNFFVGQSLLQLLTTGKGQPDAPRAAR